MNDTVRNYTWGGNLRKRRRDLRRRGRGFAKFVFPALGVLLLWCLWLTRDNYDRGAFIPADSNIEIYISDIVDRRADLLQSRVFTLLPESSEARRLLDALAGELLVPEWLLNNLSADLCHISGPGFERMDEILVSTHMTRIGSLAERLIRFAPAIYKDFAGGLRLCYVADAGVYYAVRGRTLLFSLSRDSLVHALTLHPDKALTAKQFQEGIHKAAGADIFCRVSADAWVVAANPFDQLEIALRIEPTVARAAVQGHLSPAFIERQAPFLTTLSPRKLPVPFDSIVTVSADFGMPFGALIATLADSFPALESAAVFLAPRISDTDLAAPAADAQTLFQDALRIAGTTMRVGWFGMEPYEMLPAPLLAATFEAETDNALALFEHIAPATQVVSGVDMTPRLDEDHLLAYVPLIGGQAIEPALASYGGGLLLSSSAALARELLEASQLTQTYPQAGNLYVGLRPYPVATACLDAAREFAVSGLLRGHNQDSLEQAALPWLEYAAGIDDIVLFMSCEKSVVRAELKLSMNDAPRTVPVPTSDIPETE